LKLIRTTAAFATAEATETKPAPGQIWDVAVRVDTSRFVGSKNAQIYVIFSHPDLGERVFRLDVGADSRDGASIKSTRARTAADPRRLQELERKVEDLLKEVESLRKSADKIDRNGQPKR
jgi:hypothetical protein